MWDLVGWFLLFWFWHGLGITVGYHRVLSHRSASIYKPVFYLLILGGYLSWQGAPVPWAAVHRIHHQTSDTPQDPHTPLKGFWYALLGWIFWNDVKKADVESQTRDLLNDKFLCWFGVDDFPARKYRCFWINVGWRVLLAYLFGIKVGLVSLLAGLIIFMSPQLVNTICHMNFGYRNYHIRDLSKNVWWIALISFGEGWHNNHHRYPRSAMTGFHRWWEFDISFLFVKALEKVGLAKKVLG